MVSPFFSNTNSSTAPAIQAKLKVGAPNDRFEQEADAIADQVVQRMDASDIQQGEAPEVQAKCFTCTKEDTLQREPENPFEDESKIRRDTLGSEQAPGNAGDDDGPPGDTVQPNGDGSSQGPAIARMSEPARSIDIGHSRVSAPGEQTSGEPSGPEEELQRQEERDDVADEDMLRRKSPVAAGAGDGEGDDPEENGSAGPVPDVQAACDACKISAPSEEEKAEEKHDEAAGDITEEVKRKAINQSPVRDGRSPGMPSLKSSIAAAGPGRPLQSDVRERMEAAFNHDFANVRVHTNTQSARINKSINAKAFTYRNNVYFSQGRFDPDSREGQKLLAHELTHVIQQTGRGALQAKIQRKGRIGCWAHNAIQDRLRSKDKKLITEAPIPGGSRKGGDDSTINLVGFADLYKSESKHLTVSGVRATLPGDEHVKEKAHREIKYTNMPRGRTPGSKWSATEPKSKIRYGPQIDGKKWNFKHNFPAKFWVGEIKPLYFTEFKSCLLNLSEGFAQVDNYKSGFQNFVRQVHSDKGKAYKKLPSSISGNTLNIDDSKIPAAINYRHFETEHRKEGPGWIGKKDTKKRLWIQAIEGGVYVYFQIHHPLTKKKIQDKVKDQRKVLDKLLVELKQKPTKINGDITSPKLEDAETGAKTSIRVPVSRSTPQIQADGKAWDKRAKAWEGERQDWVKGKKGEKPKEFLKEQAKGLERKAKVDNKLKRSKPKGFREASDKIKGQIKDVKKVRFWKGLGGRVLGALRFRFGKVFEKVRNSFEKMRKKFQKHRDDAGKRAPKKGFFRGWKKIAVDTIIKFGVVILKDMLVHAVNGFADCLRSIIDVVKGRFTKAVSESSKDLIKDVEPICCDVMDFKGKLEAKYKTHEAEIAKFTGAVEKIQKWRDILDDVETAIRIGVQIISCGTPPGLGCLWGLVAQLGISAGLNLLSRTDYFRDEIAKPAARTLMDAIVGDALHNFLIETLEGTPLKPYLSEAAACEKRTKGSGSRTIGGNRHKLNPDDPANKKAVREWEKENESKILKDLRRVFEKGKGKKASKEEIMELVEFLKTSKLTQDQIKELFNSTRNPASGKLDFKKAKKHLKKDKVPASTPKKRDYDDKHAREQNVLLQPAMGWNPLVFVKKPGIKVDSKEFSDAIYDLQEALGVKTDGILGENTLIAFYKRNKLSKKSRVYKEAVRRRDAAAEAIAEARKKRDEAKKAKKTKAEKAKAPVVTDKFTELYGPDHAIKSMGKRPGILIAKGIRIYTDKPSYSELYRNPKGYTTLSLLVYVDRKPKYRITDIKVRYIFPYDEGPTTGGSHRHARVIIYLEDGIELSIEGKAVIFSQYHWGWLEPATK